MAKEGWRWASLAWLVYRLVSGNILFTLLWQAAKFALRRRRAILGFFSARWGTGPSAAGQKKRAG